MPLIVRQVGRYEILREIGRGGMAAVYLARQPDLDRLVALKELAAPYVSDAAFAERFVAESRMAGSFAHPNIVTVFDFFEHDAVPYISMEYLERGSLRPWVGRLGLAQIAGVLEGLLAGLTHAEGRGIVHRDLKPENLMVASDGGVKITDFGIAKALNQALTTRPFVTEPGMAIGTPMYMAPEQALAKEVGPWTDLYSVGVIAYELIVGQVPYPAAETPAAILVHHVNEPIPRPRDVVPALDPELSDWIEGLLQKEPERRPPSAQEAWYRLEEIVIGLLGPRWRREARLEDANRTDTPKPLTPAPFSTRRDGAAPADPVESARATPSTVREPPAVRTPDETPARARPGRLVWLIAGLCVLGAAALLVAMLTTDGSKGGSTQTMTTPAAPRAEPPPPAADRVAAAVSGSSLYVATRTGSILRLAGLQARARIADPPGPRGIAADRAVVYVADGTTLSAYRRGDLAPIGAVPLPRASDLVGAAGSPTVSVQATPGKTSRLCTLRGLHIGRCVRLGFVASAAGVGAGRVFVGDGGKGTVLVLPASTLALPSRAIAVGRKPHGRLLSFRGRLYVPVERGVAVVALGSGRLIRTIALPGTPSDIYVDAATGSLFAALYASKKVAIVKTAAPARAPRLTAVAAHPIALTGSAGSVYVVGARGETLVRLATRTGRIVGSKALAVSRPAPVVALAPTFASAGRTVTATIRLTGGRLDAQAIHRDDTSIADGAARVELWQGGISTAAHARGSSAGLTVTLGRLAARLVVVVTAAPHAFTSLTVGERGGRTIVLTATMPPPPTTTTAPPQSTTTYTPTAPSTTTYTPPTTTQPAPTPTTTIKIH
jgi:serine/threonine protein kinase